MLQVRRLEKLVNGRSVLYIEQFDIAAGEVVAVIGPAHSGKTTLIRILSGMQPPSGGSVLLVNLQYIKAVIQYTRNSYTLLLNDPQETMVPLSKQCEKELQELLGY